MKKIEATGTQIVGISYDSVEVLTNFAKKAKITYPLLSDKDSKVIKSFAILNPSVPVPFMNGVPYPGTYIISEGGEVIGKLFVDGYRDRHSTEELLEAIRKSKKSTTK